MRPPAAIHPPLSTPAPPPPAAQYNPKAVAWGAPFWGHVVTRDLARWQWLPPALLPDGRHDFNGVWSGAATGEARALSWWRAGIATGTAIGRGSEHCMCHKLVCRRKRAFHVPALH